METDAEQTRSYLFLVRLWLGEDGDGQVAWCGKLQPVTSGEAHRFQGWPALIDLLCAILSEFPALLVEGSDSAQQKE